MDTKLQITEKVTEKDVAAALNFLGINCNSLEDLEKLAIQVADEKKISIEKLDLLDSVQDAILKRDKERFRTCLNDGGDYSHPTSIKGKKLLNACDLSLEKIREKKITEALKILDFENCSNLSDFLKITPINVVQPSITQRCKEKIRSQYSLDKILKKQVTNKNMKKLIYAHHILLNAIHHLNNKHDMNSGFCWSVIDLIPRTINVSDLNPNSSHTFNITALTGRKINLTYNFNEQKGTLLFDPVYSRIIIEILGEEPSTTEDLKKGSSPESVGKNANIIKKVWGDSLCICGQYTSCIAHIYTGSTIMFLFGFF